MRRPVLLTVLAVLVAAGLPAAPAAAGTGAPKPIKPRLETPSLFDDEAGGEADADDPAIWVHPTDRARSLVVVTAKNAGLRVYDLRGRELQAIAPPPAPGPDDAPGRFNNVDLVTGFRLGGRSVDLAVVTDRGLDRLRFYRIDPGYGTGRAPLTEVTDPGAPLAFNTDQAEVNEQATAYGLATYRTSDGGFYAVASRRSTSEVGVFELIAGRGTVSYRRTDRLVLPVTHRLPDGTSWSPCGEPGEGPQVEGMTVDPATLTLYAAQEDVALWRVQLAGGRLLGAPRQVERVREFGIPATYDPVEEECTVHYDRDPGFGGRIAADVEGVAILRTGAYSGTLLVSSQGDNTFYTYDRRTNRPLGRFAVVDGPRVDGSQECDGAAVTEVALPGFPGGLLVVHDGQNTPDGGRTDTNFKYVDAGFLRSRS